MLREMWPGPLSHHLEPCPGVLLVTEICGLFVADAKSSLFSLI